MIYSMGMAPSMWAARAIQAVENPRRSALIDRDRSLLVPGKKNEVLTFLPIAIEGTRNLLCQVHVYNSMVGTRSGCMTV